MDGEDAREVLGARSETPNAQSPTNRQPAGAWTTKGTLARFRPNPMTAFFWFMVGIGLKMYISIPDWV